MIGNRAARCIPPPGLRPACGHTSVTAVWKSGLIMMMSRTTRFHFALFACLSLAGCASGHHTTDSMAATVADMPYWMGGLPPGTPPRRGTPEYDAWQAERARAAKAPKVAPQAK